ncbi:unnamed protein product [Owenia fusiformis]|uniref:Uncharacterized protein n=1 Tax=Owenia fusiformis TaxID=6347 RepID=A0A8J1TQT6_OWEFU|nr:unnamed protein product [Owenia fusiformis]
MTDYLIVAEAVISVLSVICNAILVFVILATRRLRNNTNYLVANIAVADMLTGLVSLPLDIIAIVVPEWTEGNWIQCILTYSVIMFILWASLFSVLAITCERFWAIVYPFSYQKHVTRNVVLIVIGVMYVASFLLALPTPLSWVNGRSPDIMWCFGYQSSTPPEIGIPSFIGIMVICTITAGMNFKIMRVAQIQSAKIAAIDAVVTSGKKTKFSKEKRITLFLSFVALYFVISWITLLVQITLAYFQIETPMELWTFSITFAFSNAALNPIIYGMGQGQYRRAFLRLCCKKSSIAPEESGTAMSVPSNTLETTTKP